MMADVKFSLYYLVSISAHGNYIYIYYRDARLPGIYLKIQNIYKISQLLFNWIDLLKNMFDVADNWILYIFSIQDIAYNMHWENSFLKFWFWKC